MKIATHIRKSREKVIVNANHRLIMLIVDFLKPRVWLVVSRALALPSPGSLRNDVLVLKSIRVSGHCLRLEWRARGVHSRDRDFPPSRQAEWSSEQAFKDTEAAVLRFFRMLPDIEEIELQVDKPMARSGVIFGGVADRARALAPHSPSRPEQRSMTLGVRCKMCGDQLVILPSNS